MLVLTAADLAALVPMPAAIELVERGFAALSAGEASAPIRTPLETHTPPGVTLVMPASVPPLGALGTKVVTVFPGNGAAGRPVVQAVVLLIDPSDGRPMALLDGTSLTALRTGAASGVATRWLARGDVRVLTCFGAGAQAMRQIEAVLAVRPIERLVICSRGQARAEALADHWRQARPGLAVSVEPDPRRATIAADVICTATSSAKPVLPAEAVLPGCHVNGIGSFTPTMAEIPVELVARARVVVDETSAARAEAGDLIRAVAAGRVDASVFAVELGAVIGGRTVGREAADQVTFFKSVGNAVQDMAVAVAAVAAARRVGRGVTVRLD